MDVQRLLVTGATGFLGREIVRRLAGRFDLVATARRLNAESLCPYISADLVKDDLERAFPDNVDTVIHAAGPTILQKESLASNFETTRRVIDWAGTTGVRNFLLISSAAVYAESENPRSETYSCKPLSDYGRAKLLSEHYAIEKLSSRDMRLVILRKPAVLGPTKRGNISRLINALRRHRFLLIGDGENKKSLITVTDAASACESALDHFCKQSPKPRPEIFNVSGGNMSMKMIVSVCCSELRRATPPQVPSKCVTVPLKALSTMTLGAKLFGSPLAQIEQFLRNDLLDSTLIKNELGFAPRMNIERALGEMVRYNCDT